MKVWKVLEFPFYKCLQGKLGEHCTPNTNSQKLFRLTFLNYYTSLHTRRYASEIQKQMYGRCARFVLKKFNRKGMSPMCSTLVNTVVIRRDPGLALECLEITTSLIRNILGILTSLCLFCTVSWHMLLLVLELFDLSTCTSLPQLD